MIFVSVQLLTAIFFGSVHWLYILLWEVLFLLWEVLFPFV